MQRFGELIKRFRRRTGISQESLAEILGVHRNSISDWERNNYLPRSRQMILDLSEALVLDNTDTDRLLRTSEYPLEYNSQERVLSMVHDIQIGDGPDKPRENRACCPFVARETELKQMSGVLGDVLNNQQGTVVFVRGEAGSGKTALLQKFAQLSMSKHADLVVLGGNCNAYAGGGDPYLPFREILGLLTYNLRTCWSLESTNGDIGRRVNSILPLVYKTLLSTGKDLIETFIPGSALVANAMNFTDDGSWLKELKALVASKTMVQISTNAYQNNLFEQYTQLLQVLSRHRPFILILDDLQWADNGSIQLLFHLGKRLKESSILIFGVYRNADVTLGRNGERHPLEPVINEFQREYGNSLIDLDKAEAKLFVKSILDSEENALGTQFHEVLYQHTQGHALFTVETIRRMQRNGDLVKDQKGRWVEGPSLDWQTIPERIDGVIRERIDRLPDQLKEILKVASLEGGEFHAEVIAQVLDTDVWSVVRQLGEYLDKQHYIVTSKSTLVSGSKRLSIYRFHHILFQIYLYNSMDNVEKEILHEKVGDTLERLYSEQPETVALQLARHFRVAKLREKAVNFLILAGNTAIQLSANEEALNHFNEALDLLQQCPDTKIVRQLELEIQISKGLIFIATKGNGAQELEQVFSRAWKLAKVEGDVFDLLQVIFGLWSYSYARGKLEEALKLGKRLYDIATNEQSKLLLLNAHRVMGSTFCAMGEFTTALYHNDQCSMIYEQQGDPSFDNYVYRNNHKVLNPAYRALSLWHLGYPDQAVESIQKAVAIAEKEESPQPYSQTYALGMSSLLYVVSGEHSKLKHEAEAMLKLATTYGFGQWIIVGMLLQNWVTIRLDESSNEIYIMRQTIDRLLAAGGDIMVPFFEMILAKAYLYIGQPNTGIKLLNGALLNAQKMKLGWFEPEMYRLLGECMLAQGENDKEIEKFFYHSLRLAKEQKAKSRELRTLMSLSRLRLKQGREEEVITKLKDTFAWFTEGFNTPDLLKAKKMIDSYGQI